MAVNIDVRNKFWKDIKTKLISSMCYVNDDLVDRYIEMNNQTIMGKMTHGDKNIKIEFCIYNTSDKYERVKLTVMGENGIIDTTFIKFSEIINAECSIIDGMYDPYWRDNQFDREHWFALGVKIVEYFNMFDDCRG